ncbi:MAG TPA: DNA-formamidopyrimidine glycosylase family protein [Usitatibacter sp.]|nr:DNA-formamidopyrimidine glycosylase family protein [Usitatibacter sp.]
MASMPELPDVTVYVEALERQVGGQRLLRIRTMNPFVLRSFDPPIDAVAGRTVIGIRRIGKRIVLDLADGLFAVIHLMIAGRLVWKGPDAKSSKPAPNTIAAFEFESGTLYFTEAGSKRRASLTLVRGEAALKALDPGGIEPLSSTLEEFQAALRKESHTLKRSLTDPHLFSGIGNAYSDEILHAAKLSPMKLTRTLDDAETKRLYEATRSTLTKWTDQLRAEAGGGFPSKVTAFHPTMAVHGRFKLPCPVCGAPVQRIAYAENECNYCARCQTGGKLLADRSLSRLLKDDWPKSIDDL